jgi:hypothetical protein
MTHRANYDPTAEGLTRSTPYVNKVQLAQTSRSNAPVDSLAIQKYKLQVTSPAEYMDIQLYSYILEVMRVAIELQRSRSRPTELPIHMMYYE